MRREAMYPVAPVTRTRCPFRSSSAGSLGRFTHIAAGGVQFFQSHFGNQEWQEGPDGTLYIGVRFVFPTTSCPVRDPRSLSAACA